MKAVGLVLALSVATSWGIGGLLVKRGLATVSPQTILVLQYAIGALGVAVFILARGEWSMTASWIGTKWLPLLVIVFFQIAGYVFWIAAVKTAGSAIPTAAVMA